MTANGEQVTEMSTISLKGRDDRLRYIRKPLERSSDNSLRKRTWLRICENRRDSKFCLTVMGDLRIPIDALLEGNTINY